jgi:hypothetical protein
MTMTDAKPGPGIGTDTPGRARARAKDGSAMPEDKECLLARTFREVQRLCPWYQTCLSKHRGESFECNGNHPDAEYLALLAVQQPAMFRSLPAEIRVKFDAVKPVIAGDEAGAGGSGRIGSANAPGPMFTKRVQGHVRHDEQMSPWDGERARALQFFVDLPQDIRFSQAWRAFRASGLGCRRAFANMWKLRRGLQPAQG